MNLSLWQFSNFEYIEIVSVISRTQYVHVDGGDLWEF